MEQRGTKEAAEAVLRELPSVVGAFVREDAHGYPREVHLLIAPGPKARHFALDVKALLEERLGIAIDQRIISIAQLASPPEPAAESATHHTAGAPADRPAEPSGQSLTGAAAAMPPRLSRVRFLSAVSETVDARVTVTVHLEWQGGAYVGTAVELDAGSGRVRAAAVAVLRAANEICGPTGRFELEGASVVRVLDRDYALVSVLASAGALGRRPLALAGAQPIEEYVETAGALAALKAANRLLGWIARLADGKRVP
jgi:hypothetical protein